MTSLLHEKLMNNKESIVKLYYNRDCEMNINNMVQIIKSLNKLGYYRITNQKEEKEEKDYVINKASNKLISELTLNFTNKNYLSKSIDNLINEVRSTNEYQQFIEYQKCKLNRSQELIHFIDHSDTKEFYNSLTVEELTYIGY